MDKSLQEIQKAKEKIPAAVQLRIKMLLYTYGQGSYGQKTDKDRLEAIANEIFLLVGNMENMTYKPRKQSKIRKTR